MSLLDEVFLTVPEIELLPYNRLTGSNASNIPAEKLRRDGFGVALSSTDESIALEIDEKSALLLYTMKREGVLPDFVVEEQGSEHSSLVYELILAGLLQIKLDNRFYSGHTALHVMRTNASLGIYNIQRSNSVSNKSVLTQLSIRAIKRAIEIRELDIGVVQSYLYRFNTIPLSRKLNRQYSEGVFDFKRLVAPDIWHETDINDGWIHYHKRTNDGREGYSRKLYVSPALTDFRETIKILNTCFAEFKNISFKIGTGIDGLLRPDKIVAYFPDKSTLIKTTEKLSPTMANLKAHGVPFTAECILGGALSWGIDPHLHSEELGSARKSWRQWVVEKVAETVVTINASHSNVSDSEKLNIALDRLELEGVDLKTFGPNSSWIRVQQLN